MQAIHLCHPEDAIINLPAGHHLLSIPPADPDNGEATGNLNLRKALISGQRIVINGESTANTNIDSNQIDAVFNIAQDRRATIARVTIRGGYGYRKLCLH